MKNFKLKLFVVTIGLLWNNYSGYSQIQGKGLTIGDKVPDVVFNEVINYKTSSIKLSDFAGKLVIIDFWATWCAPCVVEMPKFNSLQKKFNDDLIVLPISFEDKKVVSQFKEKRSDLQLPFIVEPQGSLIRKIFPHRGIPHSVIIDKKGFVVAVTESNNITEEVIAKLNRNEKISLHHKQDLMDFDMNKPLFQNGNGGNGENAIIRSVIAPYIEGVASSGGIYDKYDGLFQINVPITQLFEYAFDFPMKYRNRMLLEGSANTNRYPIKDTDYKSLQSNDINFKRDNLFCYNLIAPYLGSTSVKFALTRLRKVMKDDLNRTFGHLFGLHVNLEIRDTDCYIIKANAGFNLKKVLDANNQNSISPIYKATSISGLEESLIEYLKGKPIVDQTTVGGLKIYFKSGNAAYKNNLRLINADLMEYGLEVVEGKRLVEMLVFKVNK